jgi:hypothetical protein
MLSYPVPNNLLPNHVDAQLQKRFLKDLSYPGQSQMKNKEEQSIGNGCIMQVENSSAEDKA